jgi:hypothetical protein
VAKVVLFGAGASYGAGGIVPDSPPLGWDLYDRLCRCYPDSWGALPPTLDAPLAAYRVEDGEVLPAR